MIETQEGGQDKQESPEKHIKKIDLRFSLD